MQPCLQGRRHLRLTGPEVVQAEPSSSAQCRPTCLEFCFSPLKSSSSHLFTFFWNRGSIWQSLAREGICPWRSELEIITTALSNGERMRKMWPWRHPGLCSHWSLSHRLEQRKRTMNPTPTWEVSRAARSCQRQAVFSEQKRKHQFTKWLGTKEIPTAIWLYHPAIRGRAIKLIYFFLYYATKIIHLGQIHEANQSSEFHASAFHNDQLQSW